MTTPPSLEERMKEPNPGSQAAKEQGCTCPVMDNWRGDEELGRIRGFVILADCPLHGSAARVEEGSVNG